MGENDGMLFLAFLCMFWRILPHYADTLTSSFDAASKAEEKCQSFLSAWLLPTFSLYLLSNHVYERVRNFNNIMLILSRMHSFIVTFWWNREKNPLAFAFPIQFSSVCISLAFKKLPFPRCVSTLHTLFVCTAIWKLKICSDSTKRCKGELLFSRHQQTWTKCTVVKKIKELEWLKFEIACMHNTKK